MVNFLKETIDALSEHNKTAEDVRFVQSGENEGTWNMFVANANFEYDNGFGGNVISGDLKIVGDDWWLERGEYDGSEWWEFKTLPQRQCAPNDLCERSLYDDFAYRYRSRTA